MVSNTPQPWSPQPAGTAVPPASDASPAPAVAAGLDVPAVRADDGARFRVPPKLILAAVIFAAALWFVIVNNRRAHITVWVRTISAPVWLVLLCVFLAGLVTGWLLRRQRTNR